MTEEEKAQETIYWMNLFDVMRKRVGQYATNAKNFDEGLKGEIEKVRKQAKEIISPPIIEDKPKIRQGKYHKNNENTN